MKRIFGVVSATEITYCYSCKLGQNGYAVISEVTSSRSSNFGNVLNDPVPTRHLLLFWAQSSKLTMLKINVQ